MAPENTYRPSRGGHTQHGEALVAWARYSDPALLIAALIFLAAFSVPVIWPHDGWGNTGRAVMTGVWVLFVVDLLMRLWLSENAWRYLRHHWLDAVVLILPVLRPLMMVQLLFVMTNLNRTAHDGLRTRVPTLVAVGAAILGFTGAVAVLQAERGHPGASITSFGDAIWWALVTMTTVGYGDMSPVTTTGRVVAGFLMVLGVGLLGTATATLASWFAQEDWDADQESDAQQSAELRMLREELAELRQLISQQPSGGDSPH